MEEEQLETIRREYELLDYYETSGWHDVAEHVPALLAEIDRLRAALLREVADRRYQEDHGGAGASLYDTFGRGDPWPGVKGIAEYEAEAREELARRGEG